MPMQKRKETGIQCLHQEDPLEKEMAIHSSILAWKIAGKKMKAEDVLQHSWRKLAY